MIRPRVWSVSGMCRLMKSDSCSNVSKSTCLVVTPGSGKAGNGSVKRMRMPNPLARWATARPIRPKPTIPSVAPLRSAPSMKPGPQVFQPPTFTSPAPSTTRRAAARSRAKAISAVASVRMSGVLPTGMPRAVAAATSTLSTPTAWLLMTLSPRPAASMTSASIRSVSRQSSPSTPTTCLRICSRLGGSSSGQTSASQKSFTSSRPRSRIHRVTKTLGLDML